MMVAGLSGYGVHLLSSASGGESVFGLPVCLCFVKEKQILPLGDTTFFWCVPP